MSRVWDRHFRDPWYMFEGVLESREQDALGIPIRWNRVAHAPIGRQSKWLFAIKNVAQDVGRKECQANHFLNAVG